MLLLGLYVSQTSKLFKEKLEGISTFERFHCGWLMIALPHIPIGAIDCIADDLEVFRRIPVLYPLQRKEVMPPPESEEIRFELGKDMIGMSTSCLGC